MNSEEFQRIIEKELMKRMEIKLFNYVMDCAILGNNVKLPTCINLFSKDLVIYFN